MVDIDTSNITDWNGRPRRNRRPTVTYWSEFVENDTWYTTELVKDIPDEEMYAALEDDNFANDDVDEDIDSADEDAEFLGECGDASSSSGEDSDGDVSETGSDGSCSDGEGSDGVSADESASSSDSDSESGDSETSSCTKRPSAAITSTTANPASIYLQAADNT